MERTKVYSTHAQQVSVPLIASLVCQHHACRLLSPVLSRGRLLMHDLAAQQHADSTARADLFGAVRCRTTAPTISRLPCLSCVLR